MTDIGTASHITKTSSHGLFSFLFFSFKLSSYKVNGWSIGSDHNNKYSSEETSLDLNMFQETNKDEW